MSRLHLSHPLFARTGVRQFFRASACFVFTMVAVDALHWLSTPGTHTDASIATYREAVGVIMPGLILLALSIKEFRRTE